MTRLFAGTPWDRPPSCERCGKLESECECPPPPPEERPRIPPEKQTATLRVEKRAKGKVVTIVRGLDPAGNDLDALTALLKGRCGSGGTVKEGTIELQGDHREAAAFALRDLGYRTKVS